MKVKLIFIFILILNQSLLWSQKTFVDSLKYEIEHSTGIKKIKLNYKLGTHYQNFSPTEAIYHIKKGLAEAEALKIDTLIAMGCNAIGYLNYTSGNYNEAIRYLFRALKIFERDQLNPSTIQCLQYIGIVYNELGIAEKAMRYSNQAYKLSEKINDKYSAGVSMMMIGSIYYAQFEYEKALVYFEKALKYMEATGDEQGISDALNNVALIYEMKNDFIKALKLHLRSLGLAKKLKDNRGISASFHNIGIVYKKLKSNQTAILYLDSCISISKKLDNKNELKQSYQTLSEIYAQMRQFQPAYEYHKLSSLYQDTLQNEQMKRQFAEMSTKYESEKKDNDIKLLEKDKENQQSLSASENRRQNTILLSVVVGLSLTLLFSLFMFNRWRITQKQKNIIELKEKETEKQKTIVEKKNIEITHSIEYALRIQTAILPSRKRINKHLENSFILYKPKDIVAGDFYWMEVVNDTVLMAACDCTGHGVPGALVSVLCHNALNRAVREFKLTQPSLILDKTLKIIEENFSTSEKEIQDGMDISLCSFNLKTRELQWAGANLPLWLVNSGELTEIKPNKQCIGHNEDTVLFTNHSIILKPNTNIFLFTDGFSDQFDATNKVKLKRKNFRELILANATLPAHLQELALDSFISDYKKDAEQTDDILVIGILV